MLHPELKNNKNALFEYIEKYSSSGGDFDECFYWRNNGKSYFKDVSTDESPYSEENGNLQVLYEDKNQLIFVLDNWNQNRDYFFFVENPKDNMKKHTLHNVKC
jgi:hypothetical protein